MDQPTARRRRHAGSANSVTVAELQAKRTPTERASLSAIQARAATEATTQPYDRPAMIPGHGWTAGSADRTHGERRATTELVKYDDSIVEPAATNRLTRTIAMTLLLMAAFGAVTAVAAVTGGRPHRLSPSAPVVQPAVTSGPAVVRPKVVINQLAAGTLTRIPAEPATGVIGAGGPQAPLAERSDAQDLVMKFYDAPHLHTDKAYRLLGPAMRGKDLPERTDYSEFDAAWLGTRNVEARVLRPNEEDGGLLRVAVSTEQFDGSVLELLELVEVRRIPVDGGQQELRIVGVQLLSAHRG